MSNEVRARKYVNRSNAESTSDLGDGGTRSHSCSPSSQNVRVCLTFQRESLTQHPHGFSALVELSLLVLYIRGSGSAQ